MLYEVITLVSISAMLLPVLSDNEKLAYSIASIANRGKVQTNSPRNLLQTDQGVITSYSIHYTKLYDIVSHKSYYACRGLVGRRADGIVREIYY